jgi:hypothetical protein
VTFGNAQDAKTDEQSSEKAKPTKFEQFISRSDVLIVSKSYSIGKKVVQAIKTESDRLGLGSMTLSTKSGLAMNYYAYRDSSGTLKRNLYLKIKDGFITQGPSIEPLSSLGSLVAQAREKLVSLGAK